MADNPTSVPAEDVRKASAEMLQKQLYAIFTTPTDGMGPVFANLDAHLNFQVSLEREGILYAAGPMWTDDEQSWEGEGLVVVRANSRDEADRHRRAGPDAPGRRARVPRAPVDDQRRDDHRQARQFEPDLHGDLNAREGEQ